MLEVKLTVAILPIPTTFETATEYAVFDMLALGTNPVTLAPGIFVKLFALPLNRFAVITLAPLKLPPLPDPTTIPVLATTNALLVPPTPNVTFPLATAMLTLLVPLVILELLAAIGANTPLP